MLRGLGALGQDLEPEGRSLAFHAGESDFAVHQLGEAAGDRQPQPGPAEAARGGAVGLLEPAEQGGLGGQRNADAGVLNLEPQAEARVPLGHDQPRLHVAGGRELDRIADQIEQRLADPDRISHDPDLAFGAERPELKSLGRSIGAQQPDHAVEHLGRIGRLWRELQPAGFDLR